MAKNQCNDRTRAFIDEYGLRDRVIFVADPESIWIARLGILKADPEEIELGVPHPTTLILDREGIVRFIDVREDFHIWLDPDTIANALASHS
jgi:peroxiredoxin